MSEERDGFVVCASRISLANDGRLTDRGLMVGVDDENVCFLLSEEAAKKLQTTMRGIDERVTVLRAKLTIGEPLDV